jgi:hypothetical protein
MKKYLIARIYPVNNRDYLNKNKNWVTPNKCLICLFSFMYVKLSNKMEYVE